MCHKSSTVLRDFSIPKVASFAAFAEVLKKQTRSNMYIDAIAL